MKCAVTFPNVRRLAPVCLVVFAATAPRIDASRRPQAEVPRGPAPAQTAQFEVASVKANRLGQEFTRFGVQPGGRFTVTNASLRELIRIAYQLQNFQITGGPGWIGAERFDIVAKAEKELPPLPPLALTGGPPPPLMLMVRSLLAERFKLEVHTETRETPIYALVMARSDRGLGPQLRPSDVDCDAFRAANRAAARAAGAPAGPPPPPPPPQPGERPRCGSAGGPGRFAAGAMPIAVLVSSLAQRVDRLVLDQTGLTGNFDINLEFTPDQMPLTPAGGAPANAPPPPPADGPSMFSALQEQLGLKLESRRGPVDFLVIDRVEHPTEN